MTKEERAAYVRRKRTEYRESGRCAKCGALERVEMRKWCRSCLEEQRDSNVRYKERMLVYREYN